jgi:hypothetical protein
MPYPATPPPFTPPEPPQPVGLRAAAAMRRGAFYGLLFSAKEPQGDLRLLTESEEPHDIRLDARVLAYDDEQKLALVEALPISMLPITTPASLQVLRGRRGGKSPECLYVLQAMHRRPHEMRSQESAGFSKAVLRAISTLCPDGDIDLPHAWLAAELASKGYVSRSDLARTCRRIGEPLPDTPPGTVQCPGFIVFSEWLEKTAQRSIEIGTKKALRNPLFSRLDTRHIQEFGSEIDAALANLLVRRIAYISATEVLPDALGEGTPIKAPRPELGSRDRIVVEEIVQRFTTGNGVKREQLEKLYPGSRHVVAWMFEAHELVESADGFVLAYASLEAARLKLHSRLGHGTPPPTGQIKEVMGWPRQMAEAYRGLLDRGCAKEERAWDAAAPRPERRSGPPPRPGPRPGGRYGR